jgi:hypothetical protein
MLTDEDRQRIRAEEIYRAEIRAELESTEPAGSHPHRVWRFFNAPVGLWLLSSVTISVLTWGYTAWTEQREEQAQHAEALRRLDTEATARLRSALTLLQQPPQPESPAAALMMLNRPADLPMATGVFPEFEKRTFYSLLWELRSVAPPPDQASLSQAIRAAEHLPEMMARAAGLANRTPSVAELAQAVARTSSFLRDSLAVPRWGKF